jgi:hypothetical protein
MSANDKQVGGKHYGGGDMQHWDIVVKFKLDYFQGQITKYVMRWRNKNGLEDLKKAAHFLEKYIEVTEANQIYTAAQETLRAGKMMKNSEPTSQGYVNQDQQTKQSIPKGGV